jgi:hypothetical protein
MPGGLDQDGALKKWSLTAPLSLDVDKCSRSNIVECKPFVNMSVNCLMVHEEP